MKLITKTVFALSLCVSTAQVQADVQNPISTGQKFLYEHVKDIILRSAEKMPEENFAFRPTPEVRTFGQLIGHIADSQYKFCSLVNGKEETDKGIEKLTGKADLIKGLKGSFVYCDKVYESMTDAEASKPIKLFGNDQAKLTVLSLVSGHDNEHYGNMVTYMRIKGIVPASSEKK